MSPEPGTATTRDQFVIAQFSDLHCGDPRFDERLLDTVIDEINDLAPDLVAIPGDLTVNGYRDEYKIAKVQIDRLECPQIVVIPGNHDSRNVGYLHFTRLFGHRWTCRDLAFDSHDPDIGCENVRVVSVDSTKPDLNDGEIGRHRYEWLADQLQDSPGLSVVVIHHHLVGIPGTGRERNIVLDAGDVLEILDRHGVDLVLAGHRHVPYAWQVNGTLIVTSGTACTWRTRGETPPSYNIITILAKEIEVATVALGTNDSRTVQRFARRTNR